MRDMAGPPYIDDVRAAEFPHLGDSAYLDAASVGPLPERSRRELEDHAGRRASVHTFGADDFLIPLERARAAAARLIGADPREIALGGNTSFGINLAALSLPVEPGSRVIASDREFPANVYPWTRCAGGLERIPTTAAGVPDEEAILGRLDRGDVSILALSAVQFASGYRSDLGRLGRACRDRGIHFVVDAIQALGQCPLEVEEMCIDVLATGGHKWLLSPAGTGFAYVRAGLIPRMEPRVVGWGAKEASADLGALLDYSPEWLDDARKFEVGTLPSHDFAAFAASLELLLEVGIPAIERHLKALMAPLEEWLRGRAGVELLSDLSSGHRSAILAFRPPNPAAVHEALRAGGVICALREGAIRVAPHLYNTHDDMERLVTVLNRTVA